MWQVFLLFTKYLHVPITASPFVHDVLALITFTFLPNQWRSGDYNKTDIAVMFLVSHFFMLLHCRHSFLNCHLLPTILTSFNSMLSWKWFLCSIHSTKHVTFPYHDLDDTIWYNGNGFWCTDLYTRADVNQGRNYWNLSKLLIILLLDVSDSLVPCLVLHRDNSPTITLTNYWACLKTNHALAGRYCIFQHCLLPLFIWMQTA